MKLTLDEAKALLTSIENLYFFRSAQSLTNKSRWNRADKTTIACAPYCELLSGIIRREILNAEGQKTKYIALPSEWLNVAHFLLTWTAEAHEAQPNTGALSRYISVAEVINQLEIIFKKNNYEPL